MEADHTTAVTACLSSQNTFTKHQVTTNMNVPRIISMYRQAGSAHLSPRASSWRRSGTRRSRVVTPFVWLASSFCCSCRHSRRWCICFLLKDNAYYLSTRTIQHTMYKYSSGRKSVTKKGKFVILWLRALARQQY